MQKNIWLKKIFFSVLLLIIASASSYAAQYDLKQMTPAVQQAISNRQMRYDALQGLKSEGILGETNRGYIEALKAQGSAAQIAAAENNDRQTIYRAIADQNGLGQAGLVTIESVFAEVQRDKSRSGDWLQMPSGQWIQQR